MARDRRRMGVRRLSYAAIAVGVFALVSGSAEAREYRWCAFMKKGARVCEYDKFSKCMNAPGRATCSRNPRYSGIK